MRRPLVTYDFVTAPFWISLYIRKFNFLFYQCRVQIPLQSYIFLSSSLSSPPRPSFNFLLPFTPPFLLRNSLHSLSSSLFLFSAFFFLFLFFYSSFLSTQCARLHQPFLSTFPCIHYSFLHLSSFVFYRCFSFPLLFSWDFLLFFFSCPRLLFDFFRISF